MLSRRNQVLKTWKALNLFLGKNDMVWITEGYIILILSSHNNSFFQNGATLLQFQYCINTSHSYMLVLNCIISTMKQ